MELEKRTGGEPTEVVEVYRQGCTGEVVEAYTRPLPPGMMPPGILDRLRAEAEEDRRHRRSRRGLWIFLGCCGLVAVLTAAAVFQPWRGPQRQDKFQYYFEEETDQTSEEISIPGYPYGQGAVLEVETDHGEALTAQEIYRQVNPSVVTVMAQLGEQEASVGTGVIFSSDGYILTNYHVLEGGSACTVYLYNDHAYEAWYVAGDAESDLAVLKVDQTDLPAAEFGDSELLTVGDTVYAIGNPLGYELRGTLTDGIVSAINRDVWVDGRTMNLIQTNAALNSGNSGGPLINAYGQVVGINTVKMSSSYSSVEGLGFAIPSATIKRLVNDLLTCGEILPEPVLGITVLSLGTRLGEDLWGVEVQSVTPDSAADLAGVQEGDYVVAAGGIDVSSSADLLRARRQYHVGDTMPMTIWRDGVLMDVTLMLNEAATSETQ